MYARYIDLVLRHPFAAILATVAITVLLGTQIPRIEIDPEMDAFIPPRSDARANLDWHRQFELAFDPEIAKELRHRDMAEESDYCAMCGRDWCAVRISRKLQADLSATAVK